MNRVLITAALVAAIASPAFGGLPVGEMAPDFTTPAALNGKQHEFKLSEARKQGPTVLYFSPTATDCGRLAEKLGSITAAGAAVICLPTRVVQRVDSKIVGVLDTAGHTDILTKLSNEPSYRNIMLGVTTPETAEAFQITARTDLQVFVIAPDGKVLFSILQNSRPIALDDAVTFVQEWRRAHPKG